MMRTTFSIPRRHVDDLAAMLEGPSRGRAVNYLALDVFRRFARTRASFDCEGVLLGALMELQ